MLKVRGVNLVNLGASYANGTTLDVEWVAIATPDNPAPIPGNFVWQQGRAQGAATLRVGRMWRHDAKIYIVSNSGGIGQGRSGKTISCRNIRLLFIAGAAY